jgi:hypothetical protein
MVVSRDLLSLESFLSSEEAGKSRIALREFREIRRDVLGHGLSPLGSYGHDYACSLDMECVVLIGVALYCDEFVPIVESKFPEGVARCLSSFLEYCIGLNCCRANFSYSLVPTCPCTVARFS